MKGRDDTNTDRNLLVAVLNSFFNNNVQDG